MLGINILRKLATTFTAVAVLCVYTMVAIAAPNAEIGEITVNGQVLVNGQTVTSNTTIMSGSTIVTKENSTATINLGENGRVELLPDTTMTLKFNSNSIIGSLNAGKVRVTNKAGVATSFTTKNSTVVADTGQANVFSIDVGCANEARCTQTFVETVSGLVTLRSGSTDKPVAAGMDASIGNPSQTGCQPCLRPGSAQPTPVAGIGAGALAALLLAAGGAVGAAVFLGGDNEVDLGGDSAVVVSPVR